MFVATVLAFPAVPFANELLAVLILLVLFSVVSLLGAAT